MPSCSWIAKNGGKSNTLPQGLSKNNYRSLRLAEDRIYAHYPDYVWLIRLEVTRDFVRKKEHWEIPDTSTFRNVLTIRIFISCFSGYLFLHWEADHVTFSRTMPMRISLLAFVVTFIIFMELRHGNCLLLLHIFGDNRRNWMIQYPGLCSGLCNFSSRNFRKFKMEI